MKNKTVYEIIFEYSTEDCSGIDTYIYSTKEKAVKKLEELIASEKEFYKIEYSHIDKSEFEIDTNIEDETACEYWWNIQYKNDWYLHTNIDLRIKEIN
jgi:helix-turn-helix protein